MKYTDEHVTEISGRDALGSIVSGRWRSSSPHRHRHEGHGVVSEDVDHFHGNDVAAGMGVGVRGGDEIEVAVAAGAEALPLVLEDVGSRPAFLEVDRPVSDRVGPAFRDQLDLGEEEAVALGRGAGHDVERGICVKRRSRRE